MKVRKIAGLAALMVLLLSFVSSGTGAWKIASGYKVKFSSEDASGIFKTLSGKIQFDKNDLKTAKFDLKLKVSSINTGNGMKNKHAVGEDWFNAAKYPYISFRSSTVVKTSKGYKVTGKLKIKQVEKTISIPLSFKSNVFKGSFSVDRTHYKVGSGQEDVSKIIKIQFSIPVIKN